MGAQGPGDLERPEPDRLLDLPTLIRVLSGGPAGGAEEVASSGAAASEAARFAAFPNMSSVRMLLPVESKGAAAPFRLTSNGMRMPVHLAQLALAAALGTRGAWPFLRDQVVIEDGPRSLRAYLEATLRVHRPHYSVVVGKPRPNAKPVVVIADAEGRTIAFAKLGWNMLTKQLIATEVRALGSLPKHTASFAAPQVLEYGRWRSYDVLLLSPLSVRRSLFARRDFSLPIDATAEIAMGGGVQEGTLAESSYWANLRERVALVPSSQEFVSDRLHPIIGRTEEVFGDMPLAFGRWHGDWGPWNVSWSGARLAAWDWERSSPWVPVGFDAMHFLLQVARHRHRQLENALGELEERSPQVLARFDVRSADAVRVTRIAYLVELLHRRLEPLSYRGHVDERTVAGLMDKLELELASG